MSYDIKETLKSLGYKLTDRGRYWQTTAIWRDGNNRTAIQIYKDSGKWKDHVEGTKFMRFELLVRKTLGTNNKYAIDKYIKRQDLDLESLTHNKPEKIVMEEIFDKEILNKLLPHYKFYNQRGISNKTLRFFMGGFATYGQMNKRFVFPIFNHHQQIHGFAGRDMTSSDSRPKWKHIGKKSKWIYPAFIGNISEIISSYREVILVESIGDMLALYEKGIKNVLVTFGLDVSPTLICHLSGIGVEKITLSLNNDLNKKDNRGLNSCIKNYLKLLGHFDSSFLRICLPLQNDFGDMAEEDFPKWKDKLESIDLNSQQQHVIKCSKTLFKKGLLSNNLMKNLKYINE